MFETKKFYLIGNNLSLDFVNTKFVDGDGDRELLESPADIMSWAVAVNLIDRETEEIYMASWVAKGERHLREALKFRSKLYELFVGIAHGHMIEGSTVESINEILAAQTGYTRVVRTETGFAKNFQADFREPKQLLAAIAASAADLLCYGNLDLIKRCEGENCILYFYDTTKNHARRWCSMAHCGNRAKANTFYRRKKAKGTESKRTRLSMNRSE